MPTPQRRHRALALAATVPLLDETGKAILRELQEDGRRSYTAIGMAVGLSEAAVRQRVKALIDGGVMQIVAVTDPLTLGFGVMASIGVNVTGDARGVADALSEIDEIDYCVLTSGRYDLQLEVVCRDNEHLLSIINDRIRTVAGVRETETSICLRVHKQTYNYGRPDMPGLATDSDYRRLSLWHDSHPGTWDPRPALPGDRDADVAIVGAGYTGLWTAYHLARQDPSLRIVVIERDVAGFGASGRNGGWCSALFPTSWRRMGRDASQDRVRAMQYALQDTVAAVGADAAAEGIDCSYTRGGTVSLARGPAQLARGRAAVEQARAHGFGSDTLDLIDADEAVRRVAATRVAGAVTSAHCAALDPARLVRGLADAVERRGVALHEQTPALSVEPGRVTTPYGTVRADVVLTATEGYTAQLPGRRRDLAPVYSLMLATEPLPAEVWDRIGLHDRATFADKRHLTIYGQRTSDGRLAFGGRGAPYHFGSRVSPAYDHVDRVHDGLRAILVDLFPVLRDVQVTHRWGGNLGVPRDWYPSVGLDRTTGMAWAGGYVGDGVATAHLAGRTVADLVLGRDTERTTLPWVRRRTRRWEPEPLRWIGVNAVTALMTRADRSEARTGRPSAAAAAFWRALGH